MLKKIIQTLLAVCAIVLFFIAIPQDVYAKDSDGNIVIVIDPGHGGNDPGAIGTTGIQESDANYAIATGMKEELEKYDGVRVYLTRPEDSWMTNTGRAMVAASLNADFIISCHNNKGTGHQEGSIVFSSLNQYYSEQTTEIGTYILENLSALGLTNNGVQTRESSDGYGEDYYTLIAEAVRAGIPAILVEHCFLDNSTDVLHVSTSDGQVDYEKTAQIGQADAQAFVKYFGLSEKKTDPDSEVTLEKGYKVLINAAAGTTFYSMDESVATVDENGLVTATKAGSTSIVCKLSDGTSSETKITVNKPTEVAISCGIDPTFYATQAEFEAIDLNTIIMELFYSDGSVSLVTPDSVGNVDTSKVGIQDISVTYGSLSGFLRVCMNSSEYIPEVTLPADEPKEPDTTAADETSSSDESVTTADSSYTSNDESDGLDPVFKYLAILAVVVVIGIVLFIVENSSNKRRRRRRRKRY